ncbi:MAG TPA: hypothetical protein VFV93_18155 [Thermomicrobiales bacterium]|nr:hypothetical protein [Thermomicrobiales bacterium]
MTTRPDAQILADCDDTDTLVAALAPLTGAIWLATDLTTLVHWTFMAGSVDVVPEPAVGRICRAFGLVTVCAPSGEPVFLINQGDALEWIEPGQVLAVREMDDPALEIRIERLDDLDARLISAHHIGSDCDTTTFRTISAGSGQYVQIYDEQLPTGDAGTDAFLLMIESTIDARRRLIGPTAGTLEVMHQLACDLEQTLRMHPIRSYIWAAVLREQIASMRQLLAA